jgi:hypothetical protein
VIERLFVDRITEILHGDAHPSRSQGCRR